MSYISSALWDEFLKLSAEWRPLFPTRRAYEKFVILARAHCMNPGRKTISNAIVHAGRAHLDWSALYRLFSRCQWEADKLFAPIQKFWSQQHFEHNWKDEPMLCAIDSSHMKKTGKKIPDTGYYRDPLGPPFHTNLLWGHTFLQMSALIPVSSIEKGSCRALPVAFECCPRPKKPTKKSSPEAVREYEALREKGSLPRMAMQEIVKCKEHLRAFGKDIVPLLIIGDGGFANRTIFLEKPEGVALLCRTRKDMALYYPAEKRSGRGRPPVYGERAPTPEKLRKDETVEWKSVEATVAGETRVVRYKSMRGLLWESAGEEKVKILVMAGFPYKPVGGTKKRYREPAYLAYVGPEISDAKLIQWYIWRFEIEVNIREEKQQFGLGQAQVWSEKSVGRYPAFVVALYAAMLTSAIKANGHERKDFYLPTPKWYRKKGEERPSAEEILNRLRVEMQYGCLGREKMNFGGFVEGSMCPRSGRKSEKGAERESPSRGVAS